MRLVLAPLLSFAALLTVAATEAPRRILFVGNSFTFGAGSPVQHWRADSVNDLNGDGIGGVPALFKRFAEQAGLDYAVSLETAPGRDLRWHRRTHGAAIGGRWDAVVLQEYSTLNAERPGEAATTIANVSALRRLFARANPGVSLFLTATWSRPDLVYRGTGRWAGSGIASMARDLRGGTDRAAAAAGLPHGRVAPVGEAFTCAIQAGVADADPYNGIAPGQIDLWGDDHYHASTHGYYLEALVLFARVTGRDPRTLGAGERAAAELGIAAETAAALQQVAHDAVRSDGACGR